MADYLGGGDYAGGPAAPSNLAYLVNGSVAGLANGVNVTATGTAISWARPVEYSTNPSWSAGTAITAGNYEIGRDADATNQLHSNVPTGAGWEWSVQDVAKWTLTATAWVDTQAAASSGSPVAWTLTAGAHTTLAAGAEASDVDLNLTRTVQFTSGSNITMQRAVRVRNPTYAFSAAGATITNAATVAIDGAPQAGTGATLTNSYSLSIGSGGTVAAANASGLAVAMDGIVASFGAMTMLAGVRVTGSGASVSLGDQTATLTSLSGVQIDTVTYASTTNTRTVTTAASLRIMGAAMNTDTRVTFTDGPYGASIAGTTTFTQAATSTPAAIDVPSYTVTLGSTGTGITSVGPAGVRIGTVTVTTATATTVDTAASLYIAAAPTAGGSVTLTASYAIWVDAGNVRFDGSVMIGGVTAPETGSTNTLSILSGTVPDNGIADAVIFYSSDNTAGNTIPSFYCEGTDVLATGQVDSASGVRVRMRINGTVVVLLAI